MYLHKKQPFEPDGSETPEAVYLNRRRLLWTMGWTAGLSMAGVGGYYAWRQYRGSDEEVVERGRQEPDEPPTAEPLGPAGRDPRFTYGRPETPEPEVARYTNFYEFSSSKDCWRLVDDFEADPWTVTVDGLCRNPMKLDVDELLARFRGQRTERQYRHRCVETWAMAVPWSGIPLAEIVRAADPLPEAGYVEFVSFNRPGQAPNMANPRFPWPYTEGLTLAEATNELPLVATGMYGHPLLKQNGAPVRLIVPWKYGYKSIKSIQRIRFVARQPATFWSMLQPAAYPFESNVDPEVARPWPQRYERMLGSNKTYETVKYNGYGEWVAHLYRRG